MAGGAGRGVAFGGIWVILDPALSDGVHAVRATVCRLWGGQVTDVTLGDRTGMALGGDTLQVIFIAE